MSITTKKQSTKKRTSKRARQPVAPLAAPAVIAPALLDPETVVAAAANELEAKLTCNQSRPRDTVALSAPTPVRAYNVSALSMPIFFNKYGDHDHNGLIYALDEHQPILQYVKQRMATAAGAPEEAALLAVRRTLIQELGLNAARAEQLLPSTQAAAKRPHPLVRPLVLRACKGETVQVHLTNQIEDRSVGLHLVGDGYGASQDGSFVGKNGSSLVAAGASRTYTWQCNHEGVFVIHDAGDMDGGEAGTNVHGLFGALVVEPEGAWWSDPEIGVEQPLSDGLYADVHLRSRAELQNSVRKPFPDPAFPASRPTRYADDKASFREYVVFFHDEPEFEPPHGVLEPDPCEIKHDHVGDGGDGSDGGDGGDGGSGGGHDMAAHGSLMPISYRAEPMINRERIIWQKMRTGELPTPWIGRDAEIWQKIQRGELWPEFLTKNRRVLERIRKGELGRPVVNEEQHHSSWLFGDPDTPILRAYLGDPVRIRLVHAGVKETHVFHLHVYEWHADPNNHNAPLIDAISISPQTGHTIVPLYGAGNRQVVMGDVIWHCHLYPHFHEGMWGIFRSFDTLHDGSNSALQRYPDGTPIAKLAVLPDREPPPAPTAAKPGYPNFIAGKFGQKSPIPPWPYPDQPMPQEYDYRPATQLERNAFNSHPRPGELFTRFPHPDAVDPSLTARHEIVVDKARVDYNSNGWYDPDGHFFALNDGGMADLTSGKHEPLFFRCQAGQVAELTLENRLPRQIGGTDYDNPWPRCDAVGDGLGECGLHVHIVKFDPVCADGACTGWNYMSAPQIGKKMVYRWWADEEFGVIFCHDHLFANYRQKHGLFGALLVEPAGATFHDPYDLSKEIVAGQEAVIMAPQPDGSKKAFREFCFGIQDWTPLFNAHDEAIQPPNMPGAHDDNGVMGVNYRCTPIRERDGDPAFGFHSQQRQRVKDEFGVLHEITHGDPDTAIFQTYANEPIWLRLVQGAHEEQHSFQIHGMRWRRFRKDAKSPLRNQQTIGLSEAFTFVIENDYGPGDYLWKLSGADDLWLGCWGLIRAHELPTAAPNAVVDMSHQSANRLPVPVGAAISTPLPAPTVANTRRFKVVAEAEPLIYRDPDLVDPFGLIFRVTETAAPGSTAFMPIPPRDGRLPVEPLVLRCRVGEWIEVEVTNHLPANLTVEPNSPAVLADRLDRTISRHVALHADLLRYDVRDSDGANVGRNPVQSVAPGETRIYRWFADQEVGAVLLQDMADFRNHRRHGLIGVLVVEPANVTPLCVDFGRVTADDVQNEAWTGTRATLLNQDTGERQEEIVLLMQDGLRLFHDGDLARPVEDRADHPGEPLDSEDQGQRGFNYRSEPMERPTWMKLSAPATPTWFAPRNAKMQVRLVCAADRPRNHSFTLHGHAWSEYPHRGDASQSMASEGALSCGTVRNYQLVANSEPGDYAYRSGVLKWAAPSGMWGILRVV